MSEADVLRTQTHADYRALVASKASGGEIDQQALREVLLLNGLTVEHFTADVAMLVKRLEAAAQLRAAASIREEIPAAEMERGVALAALAEVRRQTEAMLDAAVRPVRLADAKLESYRRQSREARQAGQRVLNSTADPGIDAQIQELRNEQQGLEALVKAASGIDLEVRRRDLEAARARVKRAGKQKAEAYEQRALAEQVERLEKKLARDEQHAAEAVAAEARLGEISVRVDALYEAKFDPLAMAWSVSPAECGECVPYFEHVEA